MKNKKVNKKPKSTYIKIVLTLIILLGAASLFFGNQFYQEMFPNRANAEIVQTNWKDYSNEDLGISFKYPPYLTPKLTYKYADDKVPYSVVLTAPTFFFQSSSDLVSFARDVSGHQDKTVTDYAIQVRNAKSDFKYYPFSIDGIEGIRTTEMPCTEYFQSSDFVIIKTNGQLYELGLCKGPRNDISRETLNAILSTLKFN